MSRMLCQTRSRVAESLASECGWPDRTCDRKSRVAHHILCIGKFPAPSPWCIRDHHPAPSPSDAARDTPPHSASRATRHHSAEWTKRRRLTRRQQHLHQRRHSCCEGEEKGWSGQRRRRGALEWSAGGEWLERPTAECASEWRGWSTRLKSDSAASWATGAGLNRTSRVASGGLHAGRRERATERRVERARSERLQLELNDCSLLWNTRTAATSARRCATQ